VGTSVKWLAFDEIAAMIAEKSLQMIVIEVLGRTTYTTRAAQPTLVENVNPSRTNGRLWSKRPMSAYMANFAFSQPSFTGRPSKVM
jgi:hypothetical protein